MYINFCMHIKIWYDFPSQTLGGELKEKLYKAEQEKISDPFREIAFLRRMFSTRPLEELLSTIVRINGVWNLNGTELAGFLSINNSYAWRRVYYELASLKSSDKNKT